MNKSLEQIALEILEIFPIYKEMPASLSGKHHIGETSREHLELAVKIMKHLCDEFNINPEDRDMLIATTYLHDLGLYVITQKGKSPIYNWIYYAESGYSRSDDLMKLHPSIGAVVLESFDIPRKQEIQNLIKTHMSHWYKFEEQPANLYQYLICIADYMASKGKNIFNYKDEQKP